MYATAPFWPGLFYLCHMPAFYFLQGTLLLVLRVYSWSVLRNVFWSCSRDYMECQGLNSDQTHARQIPCLLYYLSLVPSLPFDWLISVGFHRWVLYSLIPQYKCPLIEVLWYFLYRKIGTRHICISVFHDSSRKSNRLIHEEELVTLSGHLVNLSLWM